MSDTLYKYWERAKHLEAENKRLREVLQTFVDWDGDTWRIDSSHPNDKHWSDSWDDNIAEAEKVLSNEILNVHPESEVQDEE